MCKSTFTIDKNIIAGSILLHRLVRLMLEFYLPLWLNEKFFGKQKCFHWQVWFSKVCVFFGYDLVEC
jgi:hypothetical protein